MSCESTESKIFTVYNKNGFAFKFDANDGYFWKHAVDEGKVQNSGQFQIVGDDKLYRSIIEVWLKDEGLVAVFTQADVCHFDGKEFLNAGKTNDRG